MRFFFMAFATAVLFVSAFAVLPPDEYAYLKETAGAVFAGTVKNVEFISVNDEGTEYRASVDVEKVEKGDVEPGDTIYVDYTAPAEDIDGPGGMTVAEGETYRFWLNETKEEGVYTPAAYKASVELIDG
jgi:hypothetical protein